MTAALEVGEWPAARPGRTLPQGKTRYPFNRRLGRPQGRSGLSENLVPTGIPFRSVQPVAQSLYRLSYRAHNRNQYQEYLKGNKGGRCLGLTTLPSSCVDFLEILATSKPLETRGTVQGSNCIHLPLPLPLCDMRQQILESSGFKETTTECMTEESPTFLLRVN
jgi:hypothetical protein